MQATAGIKTTPKQPPVILKMGDHFEKITRIASSVFEVLELVFEEIPHVFNFSLSLLKYGVNTYRVTHLFWYIFHKKVKPSPVKQNILTNDQKRTIKASRICIKITNTLISITGCFSFVTYILPLVVKVANLIIPIISSFAIYKETASKMVLNIVKLTFANFPIFRLVTLIVSLVRSGSLFLRSLFSIINASVQLHALRSHGLSASYSQEELCAQLKKNKINLVYHSLKISLAVVTTVLYLLNIQVVLITVLILAVTLFIACFNYYRHIWIESNKKLLTL
ncbi:hypothetical protein BN1013_00971 [Candidatus Rubidus massiliensis]|nr:hypothetical protein BN1013_00971 [Candidatus Rubidus massiliensis]